MAVKQSITKRSKQNQNTSDLGHRPTPSSLKMKPDLNIDKDGYDARAQARSSQQSARKPNSSSKKRSKAQEKPFMNDSGDDNMFKNFFQQAGASAFEKANMFNNQRKNMEAIGDANRMVVEIMKSLTQLQTQYMRQSFDDMGAMMRDLMSGKPSPDMASQNAIRMQNALARTFDHSNNVANIIMNSNQEFAKKSQQEMDDTFARMHETMSKFKH